MKSEAQFCEVCLQESPPPPSIPPFLLLWSSHRGKVRVTGELGASLDHSPGQWGNSGEPLPLPWPRSPQREKYQNTVMSQPCSGA